MGSLYKSGRIRSYIMILLVITALLIAAPIKKLITTGVNDRITSFTTLLHDKTGLSISYEKLSPSLLLHLNLVRGSKIAVPIVDGGNHVVGQRVEIAANNAVAVHSGRHTIVTAFADALHNRNLPKEIHAFFFSQTLAAAIDENKIFVFR